MKFTDFIKLVDVETQDYQSKMPDNTYEWNLLIKNSIDTLTNNNSLKEHIENIEYIDIKKSNKDEAVISIDEKLVRAVLYDVSASLAKDPMGKQLCFQKKDDEINTFLWNKFREEYK